VETKAREDHRKLVVDPNDQEAVQKHLANKIRMGQTEVTTYYKIGQSNKFLSEKSMTFTKIGTRFKERKNVVLALKKLVARHTKLTTKYNKKNITYDYRGHVIKAKKPESIGDLKLVICRLHTVLETRTEKIDPVIEIGKLQLLDIKARKKALDAEERKLKKEMHW